MKSLENARYTISPYLVLVFIHTMQFGLGYLSIATKPIRFAGQDAWISLLLCALSYHVIIWMMYQILNRNKTDLMHIHHQLFGKWGGGGLNVIFIVYFLLNACYQLRLFIEVIQVWIFPDLATWPLALVLLLVAYYVVAGGFRVIVGICLLGMAQHLFFFAIFFSAPYFHFNNLLPVMDHSLSEILKGTSTLTFQYLGVEMLLFCYTFIKTPEKSHKWAQSGNAVTTLFYLTIIIFCLLLFKYEQLSNEIWPALSKYKFVHLPFIERFEFIGVSSVILVLLPGLCYCLWASSRIIKCLFSVRQTSALRFLLLVTFTAVCLIPGRANLLDLEDWITKFGFVIIYAYIPFLYLVDLVRMKARRMA